MWLQICVVSMEYIYCNTVVSSNYLDLAVTPGDSGQSKVAGLDWTLGCKQPVRGRVSETVSGQILLLLPVSIKLVGRPVVRFLGSHSSFLPFLRLGIWEIGLVLGWC